MPRRRHVFRHVVHAAGSRPSGRLLDRALISLGYDGPVVNWGVSGENRPFGPRDGVWLNKPQNVALASNKRIALNTMRAAGVPCPAERGMTWYGTPIVMRTDHHHAGSGFWLCLSAAEAAEARHAGATHAMEYIPNAREFRVHVAFNRSIKLTEKLLAAQPGPIENATMHVRSHQNGWRHMVPRPDAHRVTLRHHAKNAVQALGLDYGAVDILMRQEHVSEEVFQPRTQFYVLEVNTAPGFDAELDTCQRYANAINTHTTTSR